MAPVTKNGAELRGLYLLILTVLLHGGEARFQLSLIVRMYAFLTVLSLKASKMIVNAHTTPTGVYPIPAVVRTSGII